MFWELLVTSSVDVPWWLMNTHFNSCSVETAASDTKLFNNVY